MVLIRVVAGSGRGSLGVDDSGNVGSEVVQVLKHPSGANRKMETSRERAEECKKPEQRIPLGRPSHAAC